MHCSVLSTNTISGGVITEILKTVIGCWHDETRMPKTVARRIYFRLYCVAVGVNIDQELEQRGGRAGGVCTGAASQMYGFEYDKTASFADAKLTLHLISSSMSRDHLVCTQPRKNLTTSPIRQQSRTTLYSFSSDFEGTLPHRSGRVGARPNGADH